MKTAPFFFLKTGLAALALAAAGEPAVHVTPSRLQVAQTIAAPAARWTNSLAFGGRSKLLSAPGGGVVALVGDGGALLVRSSDGLRLSRLTAMKDDVFLVGDAVTVRSRGTTVDAFANASGRRLWHREGGSAAGIDSGLVFVSTSQRLTAYDLLSGKLRWQQDTCEKVGIDSVLPNGVLATSVYCGEPHQDIVTLLDAKSGREIYLRGGATDFNGEIDGAAILEDRGGNGLMIPDGYAPANVILVAAAGGRQYSERIYRPDPATQSPAFDDRAADEVLVTRGAVFVRLGSAYFRYERNAKPGTPAAFTTSAKALVVGPDLVLVDGSGVYRVDGLSQRVAFTQIGAAHASDAIPHAPYLVYRERDAWRAVDVQDPSTVTALGPSCADSQVVNMDRGFVTACSNAGRVTLSAWPMSETPSSDGIARGADEQTALAAPTPFPTPALYFEYPLTLNVPGNRDKADLSPRLLSPAARSLSVTTDGIPFPKTIELTTANPSCHPDAQGVACNITLPLLNDRHTMALDVYDAPGGTGKLLAHSHDTYVSDGIPSHPINVYLHGVAATVSVTANAGELRAGVPADVTLHVIAQDADGYPILNSAEYDVPILLTMNRVGGSRLSRTIVTAARQRVTLHYDGSAASEITVSAIVPGIAASKLTVPIR